MWGNRGRGTHSRTRIQTHDGLINMNLKCIFLSLLLSYTTPNRIESTSRAFEMFSKYSFKKKYWVGCVGGSVVEHLLLAQVMILGYWDQVPHWAPHRKSAPPSAYVSASLSLCVSHFFSLKKKKILVWIVIYLSCFWMLTLKVRLLLLLLLLL